MVAADSAINPAMITLARESRGLTQQALAERVQIRQEHLSKMENSIRSVPRDLLPRLSAALGYPEEFFVQSDAPVGCGISLLCHRKRQQVSPKLLKRLHAQVSIRRMNLQRMLQSIDVGEIKIWPVDMAEFDGGPGDVARTVRASWSMPPGPVQNLVEAIEDAGGIVIPMGFGTRQIDAMSMWPHAMPPLFFVNSESPVDRMRFTLAHELGHIVMHGRGFSDADAVEQEADRFAAEFLLPAREIKSLLYNATLVSLTRLKMEWKVPLQSLIYRAEELGSITHDHARSLWIHLSQAGYRTREPDLNIPPETPSLLQQIVDMHRNELAYTLSDFARLVCLQEDEARSTYYSEHRRLQLVRT